MNSPSNSAGDPDSSIKGASKHFKTSSDLDEDPLEALSDPLPEQVEEEVCGITMRSPFPRAIDSPDPVEVVKALVEHGQFPDAAQEVGCGESTIKRWSQRFPEIREAYKKGSASLGYEAEQTLVREMRGQKPPDADEDAGAPKSSDRIRAAKKLVSVNHPLKDYTQSQKIYRETDNGESEAEESVNDMDMDALLEELNKRTSE